ncbi:MAG: nodulation protein NfeD [Clostridiales bacterium]|nr:nodulation protein NfeD [Clostridiales bacterium]
MRRSSLVSILVILMLVASVFIQSSGTVASSNNKIYVIPVKGEITPAMASFVKQKIELANIEEARGVLLVISTLGGRVDAALDIKDAILSSNVPVVVYIKDRAVSAGALISIAANTIVMAPASHIGAAEPIPYSEKNVAAISAEFRGAAKFRGRDPEIAAAMVNKSIDIPGLTKEGSLLDMTAEEAKEHGYADAVVHGLEEAIAYLGWSDSQRYKVEPDYKIKIAQFLTSMEVASLLLLIGTIAVVIEIFIPGFGLPGILGIVCFALYFGGNFLAGNTEWWAVLLFIIGLILLGIEMTIPGFGVVGISGIIAILAGLIFAASDPLKGIVSVGISILTVLIAVPVFSKYFGGARLFKRLILTETVKPADSKHAAQFETSIDLMGKTGTVLTPLRPAGIIEIDGTKYDVISDGVYISSGEKVTVVEVTGSRIVVTRL